MNDIDTTKAADLLLDAYTTGLPIAPLSEQFPGLDLDTAYEIQRIQVERWKAAGGKVQGHKVGLTSAAMQRQVGVEQPDYGHLLDTMFHCDAALVDPKAFLQPRIEPEIAFVLGRDLAGPGVTAASAAAAVDFVLPALEIIDSRIRDWKITLADTVADNASSAGIVLGNTPTTLRGLDLATVGCLLARDGRVVDTGAGGAVLGNPLNALVWLANTLGQRGVALRTGDVILPGSVTGAIPVTAGHTVTATFAGLGSVTAAFAAVEQA